MHESFSFFILVIKKKYEVEHTQVEMGNLKLNKLYFSEGSTYVPFFYRRGSGVRVRASEKTLVTLDARYIVTFNRNQRYINKETRLIRSFSGVRYAFREGPLHVTTDGEGFGTEEGDTCVFGMSTPVCWPLRWGSFTF